MEKVIRLLLISLAASIICTLNAPCIFAASIESKSSLLTDNDTPWQITAESFEYMEKEGVLRLERDVLITNGYLSLFAREAIYDRNRGTVKASGDIRFETGEDILTLVHTILTDLNVNEKTLQNQHQPQGHSS